MRRIGLSALLATLLGAGVLGASLLPASSQQATTLRIYERPGFEKFINNDGKRTLAGDVVVQVNRLYRTGTKKRVGRDVVNVTLMRRTGRNNAIFRVNATFVLGAGKIEAAGTSTFSHLRNGAAFTVTGGTGRYAGVTGTVNVREARRRTFFTFTLNP
jgi:hypothetical protein